MIDEKPRYGAGGSSIALTSKATGGVFGLNYVNIRNVQLSNSHHYI